MFQLIVRIFSVLYFVISCSEAKTSKLLVAFNTGKTPKEFEMNIDLLRKLVCTVNVTLLLAVLQCF